MGEGIVVALTALTVVVRLATTPTSWPIPEDRTGNAPPHHRIGTDRGRQPLGLSPGKIPPLERHEAAVGLVRGLAHSG